MEGTDLCYRLLTVGVANANSAECILFTMKSLLMGTTLLSLICSFAFAQRKPQSHEQCIKQVPGDWGPNFGDEWHEHEALYWACRNGVTVETIKTWQRAAEEEDMAAEIKPVALSRENLVLFVKDGGTANCYGLSVLRKVGSAWTKAWNLPTRRGDEEGIYCAGSCPGLQTSVSGEILTVRSASSSDPNDKRCKRFHWESERFRWNGTTFIPIK
jgi:hypothetical protein